MGCRLSVSRTGKSRPKPCPSQSCHGEELHFLDEFGRPIRVQLEERGQGQYGPMGAQWDLPQTQRPCYSHLTPDLYPLVSHDLFSSDGCVPSVSYSLDRLDRVAHLDQDWLQNQFCWPPQDLDPDLVQPVPGLIPGLPCSSSQLHRGTLLSEAETDAVSSLPGHTPSSRGSSPSDSLTSSLTSEPSDSGFHSVSTAGLPPRAPGPVHHRSNQQRGRWELQSIPENWSPTPHRMHHHLEQRGCWEMESVPESGARSRCSVGNSTTTTVHFHRAERSPTSPQQRSPGFPRSPPAMPIGCRTEPCHRRALWLQDGSRTLTEPTRSRTFTDLSQNQSQRRASHPSIRTMHTSTKTTQTRTSETGLNHDLTHHQKWIPRSPSNPNSQTLRTRSNRESTAQFYSTAQSRPRPTNQRPARRQRAQRLIRQRSDVTTDEELSFLPNIPHRRKNQTKSGHKNRTRPLQSRAGACQTGLEDPLMVLRDQNLDRIRTRQILDEWTTVEELLSHGTRAENRINAWPSPLLSVTTV